MRSVQGQALFDHVVQLTEVSAVLAPGLVRRSLLDGKSDPKDADPHAYLEALPRIRARLKAYISESEADRRIAKIESFLHGLTKRRPAPIDFDAFSEDPADFTTQGRRWTNDELMQLRAARDRQNDPDGSGGSGSSEP